MESHLGLSCCRSSQGISALIIKRYGQGEERGAGLLLTLCSCVSTSDTVSYEDAGRLAGAPPLLESAWDLLRIAWQWNAEATAPLRDRGKDAVRDLAYFACTPLVIRWVDIQTETG